MAIATWWFVDKKERIVWGAVITGDLRMLKSRILVKVKAIAIACAMLVGGTLFSGCNITDIRDSLIAGSLGAVQSAANNAVGSLIINFNELFESTPDNPLVDTP